MGIRTTLKGSVCLSVRPAQNESTTRAFLMLQLCLSVCTGRVWMELYASAHAHPSARPLQTQVICYESIPPWASLMTMEGLTEWDNRRGVYGEKMAVRRSRPDYCPIASKQRMFKSNNIFLRNTIEVGGHKTLMNRFCFNAKGERSEWFSCLTRV